LSGGVHTNLIGFDYHLNPACQLDYVYGSKFVCRLWMSYLWGKLRKRCDGMRWVLLRSMCKRSLGRQTMRFWLGLFLGGRGSVLRLGFERRDHVLQRIDVLEGEERYGRILGRFGRRKFLICDGGSFLCGGF
jgi:hypothetical protein